MTVRWICFLLKVLSMIKSAELQNACDVHQVDEEAGSRLLNNVISKETLSHKASCFAKCLKNCLCESFNLCGEMCEINSAVKQNTKPGDFTNHSSECNYYEMKLPLENQFNSCPLSSSDGCCQYHNPCLNDGKCFPACNKNGKRFRCRCTSEGIGGDRCEIIHRTCQDYLKDPKPPSGVYNITHRNGSVIEVFCDFDSEPRMAWTLVRSFTIPTYPSLSSFLVDFEGINDRVPGNSWHLYQMAKNDVACLRENSTHWRVTCDYEKRKVDYVDYMRSSFEETDLLEYNSQEESSSCRRLEYVNIRGRNCTNCTFILLQGVNNHINGRHDANSQNRCEFVSDDFGDECGITGREMYFGKYSTARMCITGQYRCTQTNQSTTQFWFGG